MNVQLLLDSLPSLDGNWELRSDHPVFSLVRSLPEQLRSPGTAFALQILHDAVGNLDDEEVYCEVGCLWGTHLIAALKGRSTPAYAVEAPSRMENLEETVEYLCNNLAAFNLQEQVFFCPQETEEFFADLGAAGLADKIGVYFYNGGSDYRSQLLGLILATPFLAEQALIVLGQGELGTVRQATWDFLALYPQARLRQDLSTQYGLLLLGWEVTNSLQSASADSQRREPEAIAALQRLAHQQQQDSMEALRTYASQQVLEGQLEAAERAYQTVLLYDRSNATVWQSLGMVRYLAGKNELAIVAFDCALEGDLHNALSHHMRGMTLERLEQRLEAIAAYRQAIALSPAYADALGRLSDLLMQQDALEEAEELARRAIAAAPDCGAGYIHLGDALLKQGQAEAAIAEYRHAIKFDPQNALIWQKLVDAYQITGDDRRTHLSQVYCLYVQSQHEQAIEQFEAHFTVDQLETYGECMVLCDCYAQCGFTEQVALCGQRAAQLRPDDAFLQIAPSLVLPLLYQTPEEIAVYRQHYVGGYEQLQQQIDAATRQGTPINFQSLENFTSFYISYQGKNDRATQMIYGALRHRLVAERHPQWVKPLALPQRRQNGKIRVGYIAEALGNNSETRWAIGWLKNHDRTQFEIYCYSVDNKADVRMEQFRSLSDRFQLLASDLDALAAQVRADQLDILVFLALGTRVKIGAIANLRLAPIQCSAWGHPVTSGFPTIDYFLSSELMEPDNGQEHYSEQLVRLPNIGVCYPQPHLLPPTKTRADFGLAEDAVVYLSCQFLFKYLPQHDDLLVEIARRVPHARLVFVMRSTLTQGVNPSLEKQFRQRLDQAFGKAGLRLEDHCTFLPGQDPAGYASLLACADVFLDTLSFSGGHTTLDAIAASLPVVCCPGELMRGRQSSAFLSLLGVPDTIAQTEAEYIEIAVKLGMEPAWRAEIAQRIRTNHPHLFEDTACVEGLEQFYRQMVEERRSLLFG